jgi:hypothetical protein
VGEPATGVNGHELSLQELCAQLGGERRELEVARFPEPERLGDGERPVPELRLGSEQRDRKEVGCKHSQCDSDLQRRDSAPGEQDA